jgi:hypothetical protein
MAVAESVLVFSVAWALKGVGRALDSGPLEAWYVDTVRTTDPTGDVTSGLSRAAAADGAGLAVGALLGGALPLVADRGGATALAMPLLFAAAFAGAGVIAVLLLVVPLRRPSTSGFAALRSGIRDVPVVISATGRLVLRDRLLRLLLVISFLTGVVLTSLELLGPLHFADLAGSREVGSAVFGVVTAVSFAAAAIGSLLAPALGRAAGGSAALASSITSVLAAATIAAVALAPGVVLAAVDYSFFYLLNAGAWPLRRQLMHDQTASAQRSTTISAKSLALMLGGTLGNLLLPRLAAVGGLPAGLLAGAGGMLLIAAVSVGLRARPTAVEAPRRGSRATSVPG